MKYHTLDLYLRTVAKCLHRQNSGPLPSPGRTLIGRNADSETWTMKYIRLMVIPSRAACQVGF